VGVVPFLSFLPSVMEKPVSAVAEAVSVSITVRVCVVTVFTRRFLLLFAEPSEVTPVTRNTSPTRMPACRNPEPVEVDVARMALVANEMEMSEAVAAVSVVTALCVLRMTAAKMASNEPTESSPE
jgi:hypothetical protein